MAQRAAQRYTEPLRDFGPMPDDLLPCCTEWALDKYHGWYFRLTCGLFKPEGCDHEHHRDEIWQAGYAV